MDSKLVGIIDALIAMVSVVVYFLLKDFEKSWLVFMVAGIAIAAVSMIGAYTREKKQDKGEE